MAVAPQPTLLGERFERAVSEAVAAHRDDRRASGTPHVAHLFGVCAIVLEHGGSEDAAIAALLHGTAVDSERLAALRAAYGERVASLVAGCREAAGAPIDGKIPTFYDGVRGAVERLTRTSPDDVFLIDAADTLQDARSTNDELLRGIDVFATRPGGKFGTLWKFRLFADAYREREGRHAPFAQVLVEIVDAIAGKSVTAAELLAAFAIDDAVAPADKGSLLASLEAR